MRLMIAQTDPLWAESTVNLEALESLCRLAVEAKVDLLALPELAFTGYNIFERLDGLAEAIDGPIVTEASKLADKYNLHLLFGLAEQGANGELANAAVLLDDNGQHLATYHKRHLWDRENEFFVAGKKSCVVETRFGKLGLMICYDNEFPEVARELAQAGAQIILSPTANMLPNAERQVLQIRARAMDNQCFVACINRSGVEETLHYCGNSIVAGPDGEVLGRLGLAAGSMIVDIDLACIDESRTHQNYLKDLRVLKDTHVVNGADS
ncbi:carbon-nitrogen hydrolase family protein [Psychrobacter sp. SCQQ22]|uniref:carbon-nitrogen hydrolase family protein n=1 Tax=Psychrobacter sp. SCQQ22 TaxID=2792059 RepID=UPI0018CDCE6F|nr:carbon-nitrogen hydrolase family protein [Psychrobacter sp. SCQQ22]MBH0086531.1 carbon-nitrogen hydrolase family protein [Psychrobacter sp. SCQQ22]